MTGAPTVAPEKAPRGSDRDRQLWWLKVLIALFLAVQIPSPRGWWRPVSLILWGLAGDPDSRMQAVGLILVGVSLLAIYTSIGYWLLTLLERILRGILGRGASRA